MSPRGTSAPRKLHGKRVDGYVIEGWVEGKWLLYNGSSTFAFLPNLQELSVHQHIRQIERSSHPTWVLKWHHLQFPLSASKPHHTALILGESHDLFLYRKRQANVGRMLSPLGTFRSTILCFVPTWLAVTWFADTAQWRTHRPRSARRPRSYTWHWCHHYSADTDRAPARIF